MKDLNRREFFQNTLFGVSLALGLPVLTPKVHSKSVEPIRIGVVGTGARGSGLIRLIKDIPQFRVIACCDILSFRLEEGMSYAEPKAKAYEDYRDLLDNQEVEAVLIAVPLYLHTQIVIDALRAGKNVYCEKTMAYNVEQTYETMKAVNQHPQQIFQVGHQYHSSRLYGKVVEMIQNGQIGTVTGFDCQWNRNGDWRRKVPDPKYERIINWRMYREYSCGLLAELSAHQIDFVNWVTRSHPISVVGVGGIDYWKDGRETYDNIHLVYEYPHGVKASFTCTTANAFEGYQIKIMGDQATIILSPDSALIYPEVDPYKESDLSTLIDGVSGATQSTVEKYGAIPISMEHTDPSIHALLDFGESIKENKTPLSNVKTGADVSFSVQMGLQAMTESRSVKWTF